MRLFVSFRAHSSSLRVNSAKRSRDTKRSGEPRREIFFNRFLDFGPLCGPTAEMTKAQIIITIGIICVASTRRTVLKGLIQYIAHYSETAKYVEKLLGGPKTCGISPPEDPAIS